MARRVAIVVSSKTSDSRGDPISVPMTTAKCPGGQPQFSGNGQSVASAPPVYMWRPDHAWQQPC